jgi:hypothetical protein
MSKSKGGLQKKVSSIFDGVPLESDAVRGAVRHAPDAPAPRSVAPVAPTVPAVEPPTVKPTAPAPPSAWPKAPPVPAAPATPNSELKLRSPLAAILASEAPVSAPSHSAAPARADAPRTPPTATEKPSARSAPRVVVKQMGQTNEKKRNMILVGALAAAFVVALLYASGMFSGGSGAPAALASSQEVPVTKPVKIDWQRPSMPLPNRNPMKLGGSTYDSQQQSTTPGDSPFMNVMAIYCSQNMTAALIDGTRYEIGQIYRGARIIAITNDYVEYEINGTTARAYVRTGSRNNQTGSTDVKPDANTNTN